MPASVLDLEGTQHLSGSVRTVGELKEFLEQFPDEMPFYFTSPEHAGTGIATKGLSGWRTFNRWDNTLFLQLVIVH